MNTVANKWILGAYWGPRQQTAEECAESLRTCLNGLGAVDPALASWFMRGGSQADASTPIPHELTGLVELVRRGQNRTDFGKEAIPSLGYQVGLWNGGTVGFSALLGAWSTVVPNSAVLEFNSDLEKLLEPSGGTSALQSLIDAFAPTWVSLWTREHSRAQPRVQGLPKVGWLTWLAEAEPRPTANAPERLTDGWLYRSAATADAATDAAVSELHRQLFGPRTP